MTNLHQSNWKLEIGSMKINLFSVPISITDKQQALAVVGHWLRKWREVSRVPNVSKVPKASENHTAFDTFDTSDTSDTSGTFGTSFKLITTPNPEMIVAAQSDPVFLKALQSADLAIPDGIGVVWALKILNKEQRKKSSSAHSVFSIHNSAFLFSRLSGIDLMESLILTLPGTFLKGYSLKDRPLKVLLLGGKPGVAAKAAANLQHLKKMAMDDRRELGEYYQPLINCLSGPPDITSISKSDNDRLIAEINSFSPDLLFVAFGHRRQEKWLMANRCRLNAGVAMGVGGALDQIADPSLRPPAYINSIGLGWLYRLVRQPWRWRRQLALLKFIWMVNKQIVWFPGRNS